MILNIVKTVAEKSLRFFYRHVTLDAANRRRAILIGKVRSWTEKKGAEKAAWSSPGVIAVDNQITITSSPCVN